MSIFPSSGKMKLDKAGHDGLILLSDTEKRAQKIQSWMT